MKILAIETSCDETSAAVVSKNSRQDHVKVLSNVISSSLVFHSKTGGLFPMWQPSEQLKYIIPVIQQAIENSKSRIEDLDAIAVTQGPGLIGSLLIGVEAPKPSSISLEKTHNTRQSSVRAHLCQFCRSEE